MEKHLPGAIEQIKSYASSLFRRSYASQHIRKEIPANILINIPLFPGFIDGLNPCRSHNPAVSIVIVSYNRPDMVENLIKSIWLFTAGCKYEIIVVDNGSAPDKRLLANEIARRVRVLTLGRRQYLGDAYNIGVEHAKGKYVVLLNNDVVVCPKWLSSLIEELKKDQSVGIVGPKFLYPTGKLQEAGALIDGEARAIQRGKHGNASDPAFNTKEEVDYCSGAALALRRDLFLDVLGYDWRWSPGYYEDVDLCFKIAERGLKVLYVPASEVIHMENTTTLETRAVPDVVYGLDVNRTQFLQKWTRRLNGSHRRTKASDSDPPISGLARFHQVTAASAKKRPTLAIYFPFEFIPGGGEKFSLSIAEQFKAGADCYFLFPSQESALRIISVATELGFPNLRFKILTLEQARQRRPFDIFILLGNELFPSLPALGHKNYYICQFPFPQPREHMRSLLDLGYQRSYQTYLVYSKYVQRHVERKLNAWPTAGVRLEIVSPTCEEIGISKNQSPRDIIGVGRFFTGGHNKRHDVMIEAMKDIAAREPDLGARLHLAGSLHKDEMHRRHLKTLRDAAIGLPIDFHVDVKRTELIDLYRKARIYWHAAGWDVDIEAHPEQAEHFGISILEAMTAGCIPIVYAAGGPLEIVKHRVNGITVGSRAELADWTIKILKDWKDPEVRRMRKNAIETARGYSKSVFGARIRQLITLAEVHDRVESADVKAA